MSFRLFAYYCAICGGWAAFLGWMVGELISPKNELGRAGILGLGLGLFVALGLTMVDCTWNLGLRQFGKIILRVGVAILVGAIGGLIGGLVGQLLYELTVTHLPALKMVAFVFGWTITGMLVGAAIGAFEVLASLVRQKDVGASSRKLFKTLVGGTFGGILGGILAYAFKVWFAPALFPNTPTNDLWTPTAWGFVALGMCIGLLVGLAQIMLKDAWIKVEAGFRAGRELLVVKEKTAVGRAESCDIGLFGDPAIEKMHAYIIMKGNSYFLEDANTPGGTYVNDVKVVGQAPLRSGDLIRVGKSLLRFFEKPKKNQS